MVLLNKKSLFSHFSLFSSYQIFEFKHQPQSCWSRHVSQHAVYLAFTKDVKTHIGQKIPLQPQKPQPAVSIPAAQTPTAMCTKSTETKNQTPHMRLRHSADEKTLFTGPTPLTADTLCCSKTWIPGQIHISVLPQTRQRCYSHVKLGHLPGQRQRAAVMCWFRITHREASSKTLCREWKKIV